MNRKGLVLLGLLLIYGIWSYSQSCDVLSKGNDIDITRGCLPLTVNWEVTYRGVDGPVDIVVDWGDGSPLDRFPAVADGDYEDILFTHTFLANAGTCTYTLSTYIENGGLKCDDTEQTQVLTVWDTDDPDGSKLAINPAEHRVCWGTAVDVVFTDVSDWNCFDPMETPVLNDEPRWVQWLYGTGPAVNRIAGVTIDGSPEVYAFSGPVQYPIAAPGNVSSVVNIPGTTTILDVGRQFQVRLKNWNQCNAYDDDLTDGDPLNPVSGDLINGDNNPVSITARVVIVDAPDPSYQTREGGPGGPLDTNFCIDEDIYFQNLTGGGGFNYFWEFFDDNTGTVLLGTSNNTNPTFSFSNSGQKLVRLTATDAGASGNCSRIYESSVFVFPSAVAQIDVTDILDNPIVPEFCQDPVAPVARDVKFTDATANFTGNTRWRWEFYDENNVLFRTEPPVGDINFPGSNFIQSYTNPGIYRVRLVTWDVLVPECESVAEEFVYLLEDPSANFSATEVCEGDPTDFQDLSTLNPINGNTITGWQWDFNYDGTFDPDVAYDDQTTFSRVMGPAADYQVALLVTTSQGSCQGMIVRTVRVNGEPLATFTADQTSGCSDLTVLFENTSTPQTVSIDSYIWSIDDGTGFVIDSIQGPGDQFYQRTFVNNTTADLVIDVMLTSVALNGCQTTSSVTTITVNPAPKSGFSSSNYDPFGDNCSPQSVDFGVDAATQLLNPDNYIWTISDESGVVYNEIVPGTDPTFNFTFTNDTIVAKTFDVNLVADLPGFCFRDSSRFVRINPVPSSDFTIDTLLIDCDSMRINVDAAQKGNILYEWDIVTNGVVFNTISLGDNFDYAFNRPSGPDTNIEIRLRTVNFASCESIITSQQFDVPSEVLIIPDFTADPLLQSLPASTVNLTNLTNPGSFNFQWDFGDGNSSNVRDPGSHTYGQAGTFMIVMTVSDGDCVVADSVEITINPIPPIVDFDYDPAEGCAPLTVNFENLSQFADPDSYVWSFGAGQDTSINVNPTYTYLQPGTYTVTLRASNETDVEVVEVKQQIIEVYPVPIAAFQVRPEVVFLPSNPVFTANNSFGASFYRWDFGDGFTSEDFEPTHVYEQTGIYDISLYVENEFGCSDSVLVENAVMAEDGGEVLVPNAFTPSLSGPGGSGGSGAVNDTFLPMTRGVVEFQMLIYNRWGELLFESNNKTVGWDGYYKGKLAPQDIYVYKLNLKFTNGRTTTRVGDVNLIR